MVVVGVLEQAGAVEDVELLGQTAGVAWHHPEEALEEGELRSQLGHRDDTEVPVLEGTRRLASAPFSTHNLPLFAFRGRVSKYRHVCWVSKSHAQKITRYLS